MSPPENGKIREIPEPAETAKVERGGKQKVALRKRKESTPCHDGEGVLITASRNKTPPALALALPWLPILGSTNYQWGQERPEEQGKKGEVCPVCDFTLVLGIHEGTEKKKWAEMTFFMSVRQSSSHK